MNPRFVLGRENLPCVAEVVNRSLKADCTDFTQKWSLGTGLPARSRSTSDKWPGNQAVLLAAYSLGFTFNDFSLVVDVALERVWIKKPGGENNMKALGAMLIHPQSSICPVQSRSIPSDKWPGNQADRARQIETWGWISIAPRVKNQDGWLVSCVLVCLEVWIRILGLCWVGTSLFKIQDTKIQKSRSRNQDPKIKIQKSRSRNQDS